MNKSNNRVLLLLLAALSFVVLPLTAQEWGQFAGDVEALKEFVTRQMEYDRIPGLSIGFTKDDFVWASGFGYADLENKTPASKVSAYRLASNTKSMTAVAILKLVEEGKMDLDAEVQTYVPYFPRKPWPITVRQLLGHLGGITHYVDYDLEGHIKERKDTRDALEIFAGFELVAEPGTKYNYSSYGYNLLGAIVEGAAKRPYGDYLRDILWAPLKMDETHMDDPNDLLPGRVRGYRLMDGEIRNSEYVDISSRFAAGGTRSTVIDLLKYARGLGSGKALPLESVDLMYTPMATKDGHSTDYGMGWRVNPVNGHFSVYHTGGQPETRTLLVQFPRENFFLALAYNLEGGNLFVYGKRLFQLIMDESWNRPVYTGNREDDAIYSGLWDVFNYGLAYFDRYQKPVTTDDEELEEAFNYFNTSVNRDSLLSNYSATSGRIADGRHPVAGEAFVKLGAYIAGVLEGEGGSSQLKSYHRRGAIPFFNDFVSIYRRNIDHPGTLRFPEELEKTLSEWNRDWEKSFTDFARRLVISPHSDLNGIRKSLRKSFSGAKIYPDFTQEFARVTMYFYINGEMKKAFEAANLAVDLYPNSPLPYVLLAHTHLCFGERDKARKTYEKALEINPHSPEVGARALNGYAMHLATNGKLDEAQALLSLARELHPEDAGLYKSTADIYLKRARMFYQKAFDLDPTSEGARKGLKKTRSP